MKFAFIRRRSRKELLSLSKNNATSKVLGFFHPNCAAGGGGERVLWSAIAVLGKLHDRGLQLNVVIYTYIPDLKNELSKVDEELYKEKVLKFASSRFSIKISPSLPIKFVFLEKIDDSEFSVIQ